MSGPKQIVILGGGVIGLSTAYYSAQRGHQVTIIDRRDAAHGGATAGNAGMIVPSHFVPLAAPGMVKLGLKWMWNPESPFYIKPRLDADLLQWGLKFWRASTPAHVQRSAPLLRDLHFASRDLFEQLSAGHDFGLVKRGLLMLCKTTHALDEEAKTAEFARRLDVPAEVLDARQTADLDPGVRMDIAGSVYFPRDCHLVPDRFLALLRSELQRLNARFLWNTEVAGFSDSTSANNSSNRLRSVRTSNGDVAGEEFVICGGAWSQAVARELGSRIPIQAGKGYSVTIPTPRQLPEICSILTEARVAVTPMDGALRFGGTMEIAGLNEDISLRRVQGIINAATKYFPEFRPEDFAGVQPWRGLRPCSPDGLPYLGRTRRYTNVSVATGHGMMGLSLAPITGKLMSEILSDEAPAIEISPLNPDRFT